MQCPKCGFVMSELDTECLRCKRMGGNAAAAPARSVLTAAQPQTAQAMRDEEKECPRCGKATNASATVCDKCGYEYQPDVNRSERYQRLLAEEAQVAPPPSTLKKTVPAYVSWPIIGACLLAMCGAGWAMFGSSLTGEGEADSSVSSPIIMARHHKPHAGGAMHAVTYKVTGTARQAVVTYRGADGAPTPAPQTVDLPWIENFSAKTGTALSVSAKPAGGTGKVTVGIHADGVIRQQTDSPGADGLTAATDKL